MLSGLGKVMYSDCIMILQGSEEMELSKYHMGLTNRSYIPTHKNNNIAKTRQNIFGSRSQKAGPLMYKVLQ